MDFSCALDGSRESVESEWQARKSGNFGVGSKHLLELQGSVHMIQDLHKT